MTRYRGGTYSHTVDTIVFTDGTSARTDLIRLNPNIDAYSLDFTGVAPIRPSRYAAETWSAITHLQARAHEAEVAWIIRNSYPTLSTAVLSAKLRAAGYPLGALNIAEHEAIAGTQAAIWNLTNGLELDTRSLNVPSQVREHPGWIAIEFDEERQLSAYTAQIATSTGATVRLQKSVDGDGWLDVAASGVAVQRGGGRATKTLGLGSTLSHSRYGRRGGGYRYYRLLIEGQASITDVSFRLHGAPLYRNSDPVVHLYEYLLSGARAARAAAVTPALEYSAAEIDGDTLGPFQLVVADTAAIAVSDGSLVRGDGTPITGPLQRGEDFFLRIATGTTDVTLTVKVPGQHDGYGGRVITGVARDEADGRCTPLALAVPAQFVVEFDLTWGGSNYPVETLR